MILSLLLSLVLWQQSSNPAKPVETPPPDMDYFLGTWSFEWNIPDSPLGPGGKIKGTETYRKIMSGAAYESQTEGEGPQGRLQMRAITSYDKARKQVARYEIYGDGTSVLKTGPIGGDLGGEYTVYLEATPINKEGHVIKLKSKKLMRSPASHRGELQVSADGGPPPSPGNPWFPKPNTAP